MNLNLDVAVNPTMVRQIAIHTAKRLVDLWTTAGVVGIDHVLDTPQVQMVNLKALHEITGGVKVQMERKERYTRYSVTMQGVEFFFLSPKAEPELLQ